SFDHMLGFSQITGVDAVKGESTATNGFSNIVEVDGGFRASDSNPDKTGVLYQAEAPTAMALRIDPGHEFEDMKQEIGPNSAGVMNAGFVINFQHHIADAIQDDPDSSTAKASPGIVMRAMHPAQIPMLDSLARYYAACDNGCPSGPLPTWRNCMSIHAASAGGLDHSPSGIEIGAHQLGSGYEFEHGTIFDRLDAADIDWQVYEGDEWPVSWAFKNVKHGGLTAMG